MVEPIVTVCLVLSGGPTFINEANESIAVVAYGPTKIDMLLQTGNASIRDVSLQNKNLEAYENDTVIPRALYPNFPGYTCKVTKDDGDSNYDGGRIDAASAAELKNGTGCLATDESMLESVWRTANPTAFVHDIILDSEYDADNVPSAYDGSLNKLGYNRLMPAASENCGAEYCPKGPCVMLEMNYFGTAAARRHIESMTADDSTENVTDTWNIVRGQTYCGPAAGITPPYSSGKVDNVIVHNFPQDRQVPTMYTPSEFAGIVIPLAKPSRFPNWYFENGYWGWRQNGPLQKSGAPCYGRQVPRWMLPNTCIYSKGRACVNGYSNYLTHGPGPQWMHTLVDSDHTGMNGIYVDDGEPVNVYNREDDKFLGINELLSEAKRLAASKVAGEQAAAFFIYPYYSLPDAGLHGFSQWREDWVNETMLNSNNSDGVYASTQARFPLPNTATNWITRTFDASPIGDVSTDIVFSSAFGSKIPDDYFEYESPQQMRLFGTSHQSQPDGSMLHTRGSWHSFRRLEKFTPQGMESQRGFEALGYRVYMHPFFEYYGGIGPSTEYFLCSDNDPGYNCTESVFGSGNKINETAAHIVPFAASFINIDQAMRRYADSPLGDPGTASSPTGGTKGTRMHDFHKNCIVLGQTKHAVDRESCCIIMPPKKTSEWDADCETIFDGNLRNMILTTTDVKSLILDIDTQCNATADKTECLTQSSKCIEVAASTKAYGTKKCSNGRRMYYNGQCHQSCVAHVLSQSEVNLITSFVDFPEAFSFSQGSCMVSKDDPSDSNSNKACQKACNYKLFPGSNRQVCAEKCWCKWMSFLIPPIEISRHYAAKWYRSDKTGLGGSADKKRDNNEWYDKKNPHMDGIDKQEVWNAFSEDVLMKGKALLSMDGQFNDQLRTQTAKFGKEAWKDVGVAVGSALAIAISLGTASAAVAAGDAAYAAGASYISALGTSATSFASGIVPSLTATDILSVSSIGASFDAGGIVKKTRNSAFEDHTYDETGVNEQFCDLAVCDIASSELDEDSDGPFRCVPRGYAYVNFQKKKVFSAGFSGTRPGEGTYGNKKSEGTVSEWYKYFKNDGSDTEYKKWRDTAFGFSHEDPKAQKYYFKISLPKGADKSWKGKVTDYSKAVPVSLGLNKTEFKPTPRDAGYSQRLHDNNNYACTCGEQGGLEMFTSILSNERDIARFNVSTTVPFYSNKVHALVEISIAWTNPNPLVTATKGLYMAGTRSRTEWVERDILDRRDDPLDAVETYTRFLAPHAPSSEAAIGMVYSREPLNVEISNYTDRDNRTVGNDFHGLRQTDFVKEYLTITANSCVRFPIGVLHRSQMSNRVRAHLYGDTVTENIITDFSVSSQNKLNPGFTPTLQGYCELINGLYRFCPDAPHKTPSERTKFCQANELASHFVVGTRIDYRPLERRCSIEHKVCLIVPGSAGDPANPNNFVQGDPSEGLIKAHTTQEFSGYVVLVTPFNRTTFQSVLSQRVKVPMVIYDEATLGYTLKNPLEADSSHFVRVDKSDKSLTGFSEDPVFFAMMSDLPKFLSNIDSFLELPTFNVKNLTQDDVVEIVQMVVTNAVNNVFAGFPASNTTLKEKSAPDIVCPSRESVLSFVEFDPDNPETNETFIVPNPDQMGGVAKRCIFGGQLFPPNPESAIEILGSDISVFSASSDHSLRFGGQVSSTTTCSRFIVSATNFKLLASFNQSGCFNYGDDFLLTPVQFIGTDVSNGRVNVTTTGRHSVAVSVLGKDSEFYPATTNLTANNLHLHIEYSPFPRLESSFDVAFANVNGNSNITTLNGNSVRLLVQGVGCADRLNPYKKMLHLTGNNAECVDGTFSDTDADNLGAMCEYINVTVYTSIFGYRFEHRLFRQNVRSTVLAWILLVFFLFVGGISAIYILVAPNVN